MKYLFILGRNPSFSIIEIRGYFGERLIGYLKNKNAIIAEFDRPLERGITNALGGVISIGEVFCEGNSAEIIKFLEEKYSYQGTKNNINYVIWDFSDSQIISEARGAIKEKLKSEKVRATEKKISGIISLQGGDEGLNLTSSLIDEEYFLFSDKNSGKFFFGKVNEKCDYESIEKRDMEKPVRRQELSISPRLSKIMINLAGLKRKQKLLDPFCGIGVILQEALLFGIRVVGIDMDKNAIDGARKNLEWGRFQKEDYNLVLGDARKITPLEADAVVTEPDFGEILKKIPDAYMAKKMILSFEELMIKTINNFKEKIPVFAFTAPLIKIHGSKKRISCNIERIMKETGSKIDEEFPIPEFRESQIVGREIILLRAISNL